MKKNVKFLMIGAVMLGVVNVSHAQTPSINDMISSSINNIIQKQFDKGLFTQHADITVKLAEKIKVMKIDTNGKSTVEEEEYELTENQTQTIGNYCKINLSFDNLGNIPYLGNDKKLMKLTKFQNEKQKDMARQFVALHEQAHCEFFRIKNPVTLKNASDELVASSNYLLKYIQVMNIDNGGNELNYINTVNESYADISAIVIMIKEYGLNNSDLNYVLKAIQVQRHDNYLQKGAEEHNTHIAIQKVFEKENLEKIASINDSNSLQDFALTIANEGVQNLMTQRKDFTEKTFTKENFTFSVLVNFLRLTKKEILPEAEKAQFQASIYKEGVESGLTYDIAQEILNDIDLKKYNFDNQQVEGKINVDFIYFGNDIISKNSKLIEQSYDKFKVGIDQFKQQMYENNEKNVVDFDSKATKEEIMKRVNSLRSQFISATKNKISMNLPN